jgi:hypothetical protein
MRRKTLFELIYCNPAMVAGFFCSMNKMSKCAIGYVSVLKTAVPV